MASPGADTGPGGIGACCSALPAGMGGLGQVGTVVVIAFPLISPVFPGDAVDFGGSGMAVVAVG